MNEIFSKHIFSTSYGSSGPVEEGMADWQLPGHIPPRLALPYGTVLNVQADTP